MLRSRSSSNSSNGSYPLGITLPGTHKNSWVKQLRGTPSTGESVQFGAQMTEVSEKDEKLFAQFQGHLKADLDNTKAVRETMEQQVEEFKEELDRADEESKWLDNL